MHSQAKVTMQLRNKSKLIPITATLVIGLSGCASEPGLQFIDADTVTEAEIEEFGEEYVIKELVDTWEIGMNEPCEGGIVDVQTSEVMRAFCDHNTVLSAHPTSQGVESQLERENNRYEEDAETEFRLVGSNWILNVDERFYEYYYEQLGGAIVILGQDTE